MYTNLLHHWTAVLRSSSTLPGHTNNSIGALIQHANTLSLTLLQASPSPSNVVAESAVLALYEQSHVLITDDRLKQYLRIELPSAPLIYTLFFSGSLATVSRLCYILGSYKRGFEAAMAKRAARQSGNGSSGMIDALSYDRDYVRSYNGYLTDICNCFWRAKGFSADGDGSHGCLVPRPTVAELTRYVPSLDRSFSLTTILSLSHSPLLCLQSISRLREIEDREMEADETLETRHAGPVTDESLAKLRTSGGVKLSWKEYRLNVLEALSVKGLTGVEEILYNTMSVLKPTLEARARARASLGTT